MLLDFLVVILIVGSQATKYIAKSEGKMILIETQTNQTIKNENKMISPSKRSSDRCLDTYDYCRHFAKAYCEKPYFIAKCRKTCRHCQTSRKQKKNGNCKCGLKNIKKKMNRIVGGEDASRGEYPWMARLTLNGKGWCGGTLIGAQWVLTARHCTLREDKYEVKPKQLEVILGDYNKNKYDKSKLFIKVIEIINHPDYTTYPNVDYALLKLENPVDFNKETHIRPICLPDNSRNQYRGEDAIATGWGRLAAKGNFAKILQKVDLKVMSNRKCNRILNSTHKEQKVTDFMICANMPGTNKDACQGDSGGPLITTNGGNGITPGENYELIGVTSWGWGCGKYPGVYARVTEVMGWILKSVRNKLNTCPRI